MDNLPIGKLIMQAPLSKITDEELNEFTWRMYHFSYMNVMDIANENPIYPSIEIEMTAILINFLMRSPRAIIPFIIQDALTAYYKEPPKGNVRNILIDKWVPSPEFAIDYSGITVIPEQFLNSREKWEPSINSINSIVSYPGMSVTPEQFLKFREFRINMYESCPQHRPHNSCRYVEEISCDIQEYQEDNNLPIEIFDLDERYFFQHLLATSDSFWTIDMNEVYKGSPPKFLEQRKLSDFILVHGMRSLLAIDPCTKGYYAIEIFPLTNTLVGMGPYGRINLNELNQKGATTIQSPNRKMPRLSILTRVSLEEVKNGLIFSRQPQSNGIFTIKNIFYLDYIYYTMDSHQPGWNNINGEEWFSRAIINAKIVGIL